MKQVYLTVKTSPFHKNSTIKETLKLNIERELKLKMLLVLILQITKGQRACRWWQKSAYLCFIHSARMQGRYLFNKAPQLFMQI